jgi:ectoine hydroxylase-related dioxygenase (phytanoyl-CoA dioxygenase family)
LGLVNPSHPSGFLTDELAKDLCPEDKVTYLELQPGEVALLHNWLLHSSDINNTDISRRAFSVCYMDGNTVSSTGEKFSPLFETVTV